MRNLTYLIESAEEKWIPHWISLFSDTNGGFHERLDEHSKPLDLPKRLLTQCRQIIVYSQYIYKTHPENSIFIDKTNKSFQYILDFYHQPETGGSVFSLNKDNSVCNPQYDLYAHAFVILVCSEYYKATKNEEALILSKTTLNFIEQKFKTKNGYLEALDENLNVIPATRRQNPHMHLMEACVYMYETSNDKAYLNTASNILNLFFEKFLDKETSTFNEFFDNDLKPDPKDGHIIEAGHHAEWIWLLKRYQQVSGLEKERITKTMGTLFTWVKTHGTDPQYGGVYNTQGRDGTVIDGDKRIWQQFETLRAAAIMARDPEHQAEAWTIVQDLLQIIKEAYIEPKMGEWVEILNRDLTPQSKFLPATTPYHIYPALKDVMKYVLNPHYNWADIESKEAIKKVSNYDFAFINKDVKTLESFEKESLNGQPNYKDGIKVNSPWGDNTVISAKKGEELKTITKEITLKPGYMNSLQRHRGRDEKWKVESGILTVISDGTLHKISEGNSIYLPRGNTHCMINIHDEPVKVIETQSGICRESDNIRLLDFNNRPTVPFSTQKEAQSAILYSELHEKICQKFGCEHKPKAPLMTDEYKKAVNEL